MLSMKGLQDFTGFRWYLRPTRLKMTPPKQLSNNTKRPHGRCSQGGKVRRILTKFATAMISCQAELFAVEKIPGDYDGVDSKRLQQNIQS